MSAARQNRAIQGELQRLVALGILTPAEQELLSPRYPVGRWNVVSLIRWFTLLGAVTFGVGLLILAPTIVRLEDLLDVGLGAVTAAFVALGLWLERRRGLAKTGAALQLIGSFALQGWITALAVRFSTGSDDWPKLVAVCAVATALLAYALGSRLVLVHALVNAFVAFGGQTGYESGWGAYWLRMDYPTRFIAAGVLSLGLAWVHATCLRGARQGFARVYAHFGLLVTHLSLWFFSLFGFYDGPDYRWEDRTAQRLAFSALWGVVSALSLFGGARFGARMARGYGLTFLILDVYTFYFQFVAANSGALWFVHLLLVGGSMVGLGVWLERRLSAAREGAKARAPSGP